MELEAWAAGMALRRYYDVPVGFVACNNGNPFRLVNVYDSNNECVVHHGVYARSFSAPRRHAVWSDDHAEPGYYDATTHRLEDVSDVLKPVPDAAKFDTYSTNGSNKGVEWFVLHQRDAQALNVPMILFVPVERMHEAQTIIDALCAEDLIDEPEQHPSRREEDDGHAAAAAEACALFDPGYSTELEEDMRGERECKEWELHFHVGYARNVLAIAAKFHIAEFVCMTEACVNGEKHSAIRLTVERMEHIRGTTIVAQYKKDPTTANMTRDLDHLMFDFLAEGNTHEHAWGHMTPFSAITYEGLAQQALRRDEASRIPEPLKSYVFNACCMDEDEWIDPPRTRQLKDAQREQLMRCIWWYTWGRVHIHGIPNDAPPASTLARILWVALLDSGHFCKLKNEYDVNSMKKVGLGMTRRRLRKRPFVDGPCKGISRGARGLHADDADAYHPNQDKAKKARNEGFSAAGPYKVLGVNASASAAQIKTAYKKKCLQFHPDKLAPGDDAAEMRRKFLEVQDAYDTLSK